MRCKAVIAYIVSAVVIGALSWGLGQPYLGVALVAVIFVLFHSRNQDKEVEEFKNGLSQLREKELLESMSDEQLAEYIRTRELELEKSNEKLADETREHAFTEDARRRYEQQYQSLLRHIHESVYSLDCDGRILSVNPHFIQKTGWDESELIGRDFCEFVYPEHEIMFRSCTDGVIAGNSCPPGEIMVKTKDGNYIPFEITCSPIYDGSRLIGVLGLGRDLSERKRSERALVHSERMAAVGILAGGIAHEFNNINVGVLGYAEMALSKTDLSDDVRKFLERIRKSALRAKSITRNLMTFAGQQDGVYRRGNLSKVVEQTFTIIEKQFGIQGIVFEKHMEHIPDTILNSSEISQVVMNLLINAKHSMIDAEEKKITIKTGERAGSVFVSISDTGCGISQEEQKKIFNPFFSTKGEHAARASSMTRLKGIGMGLSICHAIIEQHNGEIVLESTPGKGSTFTISLPLNVKVQKESHTGEKVEAEKTDGKKRVLLVDDEEYVLDIVDTILTPEGFEVTATDSPQMALGLFEKHDFDLILLDQQMPKMTGDEFISTVIEKYGEKVPPCVLVTGNTAEAAKFPEAQSPYFDILEKPFTKQSLIDMAKAAVSHRKLNGSTVV